ncbi:S8 family serine peptidase, partial [Candidatus Pacearchaeota archaeon]|nr:S8 family serine peptidase [Candidatus Pacearchaeota archaeon]
YYNAPVYALLDESALLINATYAWNTLGFTGQGIKVCVIDTGVDTDHPDLSGTIVDEYCYCSNNCCPDNTGEDDSAEDDNGHGTHVIGTIVSQDSTYKGVGYNVDIYAVKVLDEDGNGDFNDVRSAITWCDNQGVDIISMSLGDHASHPGSSSCPSTMDTEINNAYNGNITIIAATGNEKYDDGINYPACNNQVISVGASYDEDLGYEGYPKWWLPTTCWDWSADEDTIPCYSNVHNGLLDLLAPGSEITSTWNDGGFKTIDGTSMATPHVAGAVALMLQKNSTLTPDEIKQILRDTGRPIWDSETETTYPRIDVAEAIEEVPFNNCSCTSWSSGSCGGGSCSGFQRQHTRTCTPSGCAEESKCEYDETCVGGDTITVCKAGAPTCDYDNIQDALDNAITDDMIEITDEGVYEEDLYWTATGDYVLLNCKGATISPWSVGIRVPNDEDKWAIINCIFNGSQGIIVNGTSGTTYEILNSIFDVEEKGIKFDGEFSGIDIKDDVFVNAEEEGIYFTGDGLDTAGNAIIERNTFLNNYYSIRLRYSQWNNIRNNIFEDNDYGIYFLAAGNDLENYIHYNNLSNNAYGIYINNQDGLEIYNNDFCPSNSIYDIYTTNMYDSIGGGNRCEKPDGWSDSGTTGCTYYCDTPAEVNLLYPNDNSTYTTKGNITLVCQAEDNSNLVNVTLYHNISGTWQANQTKNISGTSNITVFTLSNIPSGTNFIWNCLAYDNKSRGGFADENFTVEIIVDNTAPNVNINSPLNQTYETSLINFNVTLNEDGICRYSLNNGITNITMSSTDNRNFTATNSSIGNGAYLVNFYCQDGVGNMNNSEKVYFSVDVPDDTHKFFHKNSSGSIVAWLGNLGNIVLKGKCYSGGNCDNPGANSFIIRNSTNANVAYINSTGDMCITTGDCSDQSAVCNPTRDAFIIRNLSNYNMSYIDFDGDLCLTGRLYENSEL